MRLKIGTILFFIILTYDIFLVAIGTDTARSYLEVIPFAILFVVYFSYHTNLKNISIIHSSVLLAIAMLLLQSILVEFSPENSGGSTIFSFLLIIFSHFLIIVGLSFEKKEEKLQGFITKNPMYLIPYGIFSLVVIILVSLYIKKNSHEFLSSALILSTIILNITALNRKKKVKSHSFDMVFFGTLLLFIHNVLTIIETFYDPEFNGHYIADVSKKVGYFIVIVGILIINRERQKKKFKARPFIRARSSTSPHLPE